MDRVVEDAPGPFQHGLDKLRRSEWFGQVRGQVGPHDHPAGFGGRVERERPIGVGPSLTQTVQMLLDAGVYRLPAGQHHEAVVGQVLDRGQEVGDQRGCIRLGSASSSSASRTTTSVPRPLDSISVRANAANCAGSSAKRPTFVGISWVRNSSCSLARSTSSLRKVR